MFVWRSIGTGQLASLMQDAREIGERQNSTAASLPTAKPRAQTGASVSPSAPAAPVRPTAATTPKSLARSQPAAHQTST